jgi:soluble lytic murein transglycosylase-like protein
MILSISILFISQTVNAGLIRSYDEYERYVIIKKNFPNIVQYWSTIRDIAYKYKIDPLLEMAIIKHESNFKPSAKSHAGAIGIAQIMPRTAQITADIHNIENYNLWNYKDNILISCAHLSDLFDFFSKPEYLELTMVNQKTYSKQLVYVIASYNAGKNRATYWYLIGETRVYVPRVLKSYDYYKKVCLK